MTYNRVNEYTLGDKMKNQFRGRGAALHGIQASTTSDLLNRASRGNDPRVNCSEEAFRENYRAKKSFASRKSASRVNTARHASENKKRQRYTAASHENVSEKPRNRSGRVDVEVNDAITPAIVEKAISPQFIMFIIVGAVLFMGLIFSIAEVYRATNEISRLENQISERENHIELLELKLEEKNDIEVIEQIAREKLGMVGEESVQRRYISLSSGEHIEIFDEPEAETSDGIVLSSIFTALGKFFDQFS